MRNLTLATASLAAILLAGPCFADDTATTPPPQTGSTTQPAATPAGVAATTPPPAHPRRHCVTDADTGRLIPTTTCYTEEQWQARLAAQRAAHGQAGH